MMENLNFVKMRKKWLPILVSPILIFVIFIIPPTLSSEYPSAVSIQNFVMHPPLLRPQRLNLIGQHYHRPLRHGRVGYQKVKQVKKIRPSLPESAAQFQPIPVPAPTDLVESPYVQNSGEHHHHHQHQQQEHGNDDEDLIEEKFMEMLKTMEGLRTVRTNQQQHQQQQNQGSQEGSLNSNHNSNLIYEHNNEVPDSPRVRVRQRPRPEEHHVEKHHTCYRPCSTDPASRLTCTYNFTVANYYVLSPHCYECPNITSDCSRHGCLPADGRQRPIAVVNKKMPGPAIRVCEGDTVVVDLTNKLVGQETTIHWHGIHQRNTPWMDGVPHLTQCPIHQGTRFRYKFDTPLAGTYYWHSHSGLQRADGVFGPLTVRRARNADVQSQLYDHDLAEHEIIVWDWLSGLALTGFLVGHVTDEREFPRSILVNGRGFPPNFFENFQFYDTLRGTDKPFVPLYEARVRQNRAYRFRLISNGITLCPVEMSIEGHSMLVIAADGFDMQPVTVQSLVIHAGERWDFVVRADQPVGSYWMKFRGHIDCNTTQTFQLAVLNYEGIPRGSLPPHTITTFDQAGPSQPGLQLNPVNVAPGIPGESITVAEISSLVDDDPQIIKQVVPDHQFYLAYDFNPVPNVNFGKPTPNKSPGQLRMERASLVHFLPQLNFISHAMPTSPPLVQPETIPFINRCNAETKRADGIDCTTKHCKCTHWLKVRLNSIVEIVLVDMGINFDAAHPFHLHGHTFRVVALERLGNSTTPEFVRQWDSQGLIPRRRANAPIKDTVYVPDGGYTILRFRATNPGFWFFHCHIEFHAERGMSVIFQVGNQNEIPRAPLNFPTCGDYLPPI